MPSRITEHFRSNIVAYLALFVALSGTAYAAGKIGSRDIRKGAVKSKQIGDNRVRSKDIRDENGVKSRDLKNDNIRSVDIKDGDLSEADIATGSLTGKSIKDDSLTAAQIDESTFPSTIRLNLPPTSWVTSGIPDADVTYFIGLAKVEQGAGVGTSRNLLANVQTPNQIGGRSMELTSFEFCYAAAASAVLSELRVRTIESTSETPFSDTTVISDDTDRSDTGCRRYEPAQTVVLGPNEFVEPGVSIQFGGGAFSIYRSTLVLEPR
jgi:hypothetical protein